MPVIVTQPIQAGGPPFGAGTWNVVLDPTSISTGRTQFPLNQGPIRIDQTGIDWGDAAIQAFMSDQRIGSEAVDYRIPNRQVRIPLFLGADESNTEEQVRSQLQQKTSLFQREGGFIMRQRANGPAMYADVVNATLTLPDVWGETGYVEPNVILTLECLPDFYGDEIQLDTQTATNGVFHQVLTQGGSQAQILGDAAGRARITVADTSNNAQMGLVWGFRSRYYDPAATASLFYEAEAMTPQNGAAIVSTVAGSSAGYAVRLASLPGSAWTTVLTTDLPGTGSLTHRGSYRVFARVFSSAAAAPQMRFQWQVGSLYTPLTNPASVLVSVNNWHIVDFGDIRVTTTPTGTYAWTGGFQVYPAAAGDPFTIDTVFFVPLDDTAGRLEANLSLFATTDCVIAALGQVEMRFDGMYRPNPATAPWAPVSKVIGDLVRIPPSGIEQRVCELFVKPTRGDLDNDDNYADAGIDAFTVQVRYRPVWIHRP